MSKEVIPWIILGAVGLLIVILACEGVFALAYRGCKKLGIWWVSGQWKVPDQIQFREFKGQQIVVLSGRPVGTHGLHLLLSTDKGQQMVSAGAAVDTGEFWRTWKHLGGQVEGWVDEEGEPFDPTE